MNSELRAYNEQEKLSQWAQVVTEYRGSGKYVRIPLELVEKYQQISMDPMT